MENNNVRPLVILNPEEWGLVNSYNTLAQLIIKQKRYDYLVVKSYIIYCGKFAAMSAQCAYDKIGHFV